MDKDLRDELRALQASAKDMYPSAERLPTEVSAIHALAVLEAADLQDASSRRIETATARLATFTMWLMIVTGVLAAATVALVIATVGE